eukprot:883013-Rhodomonas_salina.1
MRSSPWTFEAGAGVQHLGGCQRCSAHPKVPQPPPSPLAPIAAALKLLVALSARVLDRAHQPRLSRHPGQRGERGASQEERRTENLVEAPCRLGAGRGGPSEARPAVWARRARRRGAPESRPPLRSGRRSWQATPGSRAARGKVRHGKALAEAALRHEGRSGAVPRCGGRRARRSEVSAGPRHESTASPAAPSASQLAPAQTAHRPRATSHGSGQRPRGKEGSRAAQRVKKNRQVHPVLECWGADEVRVVGGVEELRAHLPAEPQEPAPPQPHRKRLKFTAEAPEVHSRSALSSQLNRLKFTASASRRVQVPHGSSPPAPRALNPPPQLARPAHQL